ncbi:MAG: FAD-dependent oxidoreductase, partial [Lachnospiraceae bacterium]|nr:FAD-dependent oxidoreductase [Lachnospiraceae bacterium]
MENVEILYSHVVKEICGEDAVEKVVLQDVKTGEEKDLPLNGVFIAVGIHPDSELAQGIADLDAAGYVIADESCASSAAGLFVAGDVRKKALRQVVTAVADGANAVTSVNSYLRF